jgi:hypothetical protein
VKLYHVIKKKEILKTLTFLDDFSRKFPLLTFSNVHLGSLAQQGNVHEKDIKMMIVFMDYLKIKKAYVSINDIHALKVKKRENLWKITVVSLETKGEFTIEHVYKI